ncbi:MAG: hypothetical protein M9953_01610 [Thermomicrobiales bacterium]|nr:hypothetical protein [Thermomicrobiales bacterium]MCO5224009.1 hypothetical protein [Thermomicrobiales bacterium]
MSSSDPLHVAADLRASIEQLIATAMQQSRTNHDQQLTALLKETLRELETQQSALAVMAERIRVALSESEVEPTAESEPASAIPIPAATSIIAPNAILEASEVDVIAHGATLSHASGLQSLLRGMTEVTELQTRQFVNGELRLHAAMAASLDTQALSSWLEANNGTIITLADDVIEIAFSSRA